MTRPIVQTVRFKAPAKALYGLYMNPARHAEATGGKVMISPEPGSRFSAFDGELLGTMLYTLKDRMVVQRWRSSNFAKGDPDSILTLIFSNDGDGGLVELCHANVPAHDHAGVRQGWRDYYWTPWAVWLADKAKD